MLQKKLLLTIFLTLGILIAGGFMEWRQGEGFLKLTLICTAGLAGYFLYQLLMFSRRQYDCFNGEVTEIRLCRGRKKQMEVVVTAIDGAREEFMVSTQSGIQKGKRYRFYLMGGNLLGAEEEG